MRKVLLLTGALIVLLCGCTVNQAFVEAVEQAWDVIEPEYTRYIDQDPTLSDASKVTRKRTAALLRTAINEAKE